jgi:hypothetical protein
VPTEILWGNCLEDINGSAELTLDVHKACLGERN